MPATPPETNARETFVCLRCGGCCRGEGIVRVGAREIKAAAEFLGVSEEDFTRLYTVLRPDRRGLMLGEKEDGTCTMLAADNRCRIHAVKPDQCKTFPWKWRNDDSSGICPAITPPVNPNPEQQP